MTDFILMIVIGAGILVAGGAMAFLRIKNLNPS